MTTKSTVRGEGDLNANWIDANVPDGYTVATVGDVIITQPILEFLRREVPNAEQNTILKILASADLVVGNFEGSALDLRSFDGHPEAESGFSWLLSAPEVAKDLKVIGFDAMTRANNHATDWGVRGMKMTDDLLTAAGIAIAGTGASMAAARAPVHIFGDKATASLVSWTSTFERNSPAADPLGQIAGRPGASTLRTTRVVLVSQARWDQLKDIRDAQPEASLPSILIDFDQRNALVTLFGQHYKVNPSDANSVQVLETYNVDEGDQASILLNIRQAKQTSDFTVVASHTHEPNNWTETPPAFLEALAKQAIESGADMVCGHGPHRLRGIQIHEGKPIFYSLANFCFSENARAVMPREEWENRIWNSVANPIDLNPSKMTTAEFMEWTRVNGVFPESVWFESVIAVARFGADGKVNLITLYPIELGFEGRDAQRGIPALASLENSKLILERLAGLCTVYGTVINIDETTGVGTIALPVPGAGS